VASPVLSWSYQPEPLCAPLPCWPVSGGSSSREHGSRARSSCAPPHSRHRARLQTERVGQRTQWAPGDSEGSPGLWLTSNHLHIEPQPSQGLLHIEITFHQLIQCLRKEQFTVPTCPPKSNNRATAPPPRATGAPAQPSWEPRGHLLPSLLSVHPGLLYPLNLAQPHKPDQSLTVSR
jgi:hypothetical protein